MQSTKLYLQYAFAILMAFTIALSSTGLQFFHHHCYTSGQSDFIISLPISFQSDNDLHSHCHCTTNTATEENCEHCVAPIEPNSNEHLNCCETDLKIVQLKTEYIISQTLETAVPLIILPFFSTHTINNEEICVQEAFNDFKPDDAPPKPLYGKFLLTLHKQLKLALS